MNMQGALEGVISLSGHVCLLSEGIEILEVLHLLLHRNPRAQSAFKVRQSRPPLPPSSSMHRLFHCLTPPPSHYHHQQELGGNVTLVNMLNRLMVSRTTAEAETQKFIRNCFDDKGVIFRLIHGTDDDDAQDQSARIVNLYALEMLFACVTSSSELRLVLASVQVRSPASRCPVQRLHLTSRDIFSPPFRHLLDS